MTLCNRYDAVIASVSGRMRGTTARTRSESVRMKGVDGTGYGGMCDHEGKPVRFLFENRIRAFRNDYSAVQSGIHMLSSYMGPGKKLKLSEISEAVSLIVSSDEVTSQTLGQKDGEQKE